MNHRSHLSFAPLEKLFPGRNDILVYKHPTTEPTYEQRRPGPDDPHWKIPITEWQTVLERIDQGESLRKVAGDYGVSYEAVRRVIRAGRQQQQAGYTAIPVCRSDQRRTEKLDNTNAVL